MKIYLYIILLTLICTNLLGQQRSLEITSQESENAHWWINASVLQSFGHTSYFLSALSEIGEGDVQRLRSELVFPMDVTTASLALGWQSAPTNNRAWAFELAVLTNLNDPQNSMTDDDWIGDVQVVHTESQSKLKLNQITLRANYLLGVNKPRTFTLLSQLIYQNMIHNVIGYEGWIANYSNQRMVEISGSQPVIDYEVTYFTPQLGVGVVLRLKEWFTVDFNVLGGILFAADTDHHLVRSTISEGTGTGFSLHVDGSFNFLTTIGKKLIFPISLVGKIDYFDANGNQSKLFTINEGPNEAGTKLTGIGHEFVSLQYGIGIKIGINF